MWKWLIGIGVTLVVLVGGAVGAVFAMGGPQKIGERFTPKPVLTKVRAEEVARGDLTRSISAPGPIEPVRVVKIGAQVSSRVIALPFEEGAEVKAGDVVVRLDATELEARLRAAQSRLLAQEASLDGVRADVRLREIDLGRQRELYQTKDVSKSVLDAAEASYAQAQASLASGLASVEAAKSEIVEREKDLTNAVIATPIDGVIVAQQVEVGEQVLGTFNNAGTVLMEIADFSTVLMKAKVDETNIASVKPGQVASVFINAFEDRTFEGVVEKIGLQRQIDRDGTGYFTTEVRLKVPPGEIRLTGAMGNCEIEVEEFRDVIRVPTQSVLDRLVEELPADVKSGPHVNQSKMFARVVYAVENGKTVATPVLVGASDLTHTIILAGVEPGARIVTGPFKALLGLAHGQAVEVEGDKPPVQPAEGVGGAGEQPAADTSGAAAPASDGATAPAGS